MQGETGRSYTYTPLAEIAAAAAAAERRDGVHAYGVIVSRAPPSPTAFGFGHDLRLADESLPGGLRCTLFSDSPATPRAELLAPGRVLRLHRATAVTRHDDAAASAAAVVLQGRTHMRGFTWVSVGREGDGLSVVPSEDGRYTFTAEDRARVAALFSWIDQNQHLLQQQQQQQQQLSRRKALVDIRVGEYVQRCVCFAVASSAFMQSRKPHAEVWLWDGSGSAVFSWSAIGDIIGQNGTRCPPPQVRGLSLGAPVRMSVWVPGFFDAVKEAGSWLLIEKAHVKQKKGEEAVLEMQTVSGLTSIKVVPETHPEVQALLWDHAARVEQWLALVATDSSSQQSAATADPSSSGSTGVAASGVFVDSAASPSPPSLAPAPPAPLPPTQPLPPSQPSRQASRKPIPSSTPNREVPLTSLSAVLASAPPSKFHCRLRVLDFWPKDFSQFVSLCCEACMWSEPLPKDVAQGRVCPKCSKPATLEFLFQLRLGDDTAILDAIVFGEEARRFLVGISPCDLNIDNVSRELLGERIQGLVSTPTANPTFDCCLFSYLPQNCSTTRFRLFDTTMVV